MKREEILSRLASGILICDGAMGTQIAARKPGFRGAPELLNRDDPGLITAVHTAYLDAGCHLIQTNTFGASRLKLAESGLADRIQELNERAWNLAQQAVAKSGRTDTTLLCDIGPTGKLPEPYGPLSFEDLYENFREQAEILVSCGAEGFIIETMSDLQEARAALIAIREAAPKALIVCQMTFGKNGRTSTGTDPLTAACVLDRLGADIIGTNCGTGPEDLQEIVAALTANTRKPVSAQPNAGLPVLQNGETVFPMNPAAFAEEMSAIVSAGASLLGGCCGTTPDHIRLLSGRFKSSSPRPDALRPAEGLVLTGRSRLLRIGQSYPVRILGERINPTANKNLARELAAGGMTVLREEALTQVSEGAEALDVNIAEPSVHEPSLMPRAVLALQNLVPVTLILDSTNPSALEAGLRVYAGRALVNSLSAKKAVMERLLPAAKKYGAALVLLPVDEKGIPRTAQDRLKVIERLLTAALDAGFERTDLIADGLVLAAATGQSWIPETLATIRLTRETFGLATILGVSNVSFGLPKRPILNASFLSMACAAGLDAAIINPGSEPVRQAIDAANLLTGRDHNGRTYIGRHAAQDRKNADHTGNKTEEHGLRQAILQGLKEEAVRTARQSLAEGLSAKEILNTLLLPAMSEVGSFYENGTYFLPQLILAAEAMQEVMKTLRPLLGASSAESVRGRLVIATVKGDVHDIGKNIVTLMLENDGWDVRDLGKDVDNEEILKAAADHSADLICLSALMTTTMTAMADLARTVGERSLPYALLIGGAAVNARFAEEIGASYAPDAFTAVRTAARLGPKGLS